MNKNSDKKAFAKAVADFHSAAINLTKAYYDVDGDFCNRLYPFPDSFDEVTAQISDWDYDVQKVVSKLPLDGA